MTRSIIWLQPEELETEPSGRTALWQFNRLPIGLYESNYKFLTVLEKFSIKMHPCLHLV